MSLDSEPGTGAAGPPVPALPRTDGLGRTAARGAAVTLAGQAARVVVQFASVIVLARLLDPHDYGLLAVGLVVVGVGEIFRDLGLSTAAIQAPHLSTAQRDGLFWVNTAAGLVLGALAVGAAGPIATAFGEPELRGIVQALSLTFVLNGLTAQHRAGLIRELRFGPVAGGELVAQFVAVAVAVSAAALGAQYWSLVVQQLVQATVLLVTVVALGRWVPGPPRRGAGLRPLLRFGVGITGTQGIYYLGNNLDNLSLGLFAGPTALGLYNRGFQLVMTPLNQVRSPATSVAVPVLARLQDDPERAGHYLRRGQLAFGFSLVPAMALVAGAAVPIVDLLLGERWSEVAPVLALLAVAGSAQTLAYVGSWVYLSRGLSSALLRYTTVTLVLNAVCIAAGVPFGVVGVAAGYAVAALLEWPLSLWWLSRITPLPVRELLSGALRITACAAAAGAVCLAVTGLTAEWHSLGRVLAGVGAGLATYGVAALVPAIRDDLAGVVAWARAMAGRGR